jgi:hypothetical protein
VRACGENARPGRQEIRAGCTLRAKPCKLRASGSRAVAGTIQETARRKDAITGSAEGTETCGDLFAHEAEALLLLPPLHRRLSHHSCKPALGAGPRSENLRGKRHSSPVSPNRPLLGAMQHSLRPEAAGISGRRGTRLQEASCAFACRFVVKTLNRLTSKSGP